MQTYVTLYKNEKRGIKLCIYNNDKDAFQCSEAYASVLDENSTVVRAERLCYTDNESAWDIISTDVTATPGIYFVKWRIVKDSETYHHLTKIEVVEL
jgi:hypothetical protein